MVAFPNLVTILAAAGLLSHTIAEGNPSSVITDTIIPGAYIVELAASQDFHEFYAGLEGLVGKSFTSVQKFSYSLFKGVSIRVPNSKNSTLDSIAHLPGVLGVWPVEKIDGPDSNVKRSRNGIPSKKRAAAATEAYPTHAMSQVDQLHNEGVYGSGVKIAVIDTGIDYTHPALGGCFGPGCLVSYGADLVGDDFSGHNSPIPDSDPMDSCVGHGTHVAGIIAAPYNAGWPLGFSGVAPGVKLGAYRVLGCAGLSTLTEVVFAALHQAYEDGSHIITSSIGSSSDWRHDLWAMAVSRIVAAGVPCLVAAGNEAEDLGIFSTTEAANPKSVFAVGSVNSIQQPQYNPSSQTVSSAIDPVNGGFMGSESSWGPSWELEMKPNFVASGHSIFSTFPVANGSYAVLSGTSMATPFVAGVLALIAEVRGLSILRNPALLEILLSSTSNALLFHNSIRNIKYPWLAPVAQQGAGLIQAYRAAHLTTILDTPSISLNDSDNFVATRTIALTNTGSAAATYTFGHNPAIGIYPLYADSIYRLPTYLAETTEAFAGVVISPTTLYLGPGAKGSVSLTFTQPTRGVPAGLPLYSGYITINGTQGENLSVPYHGVKGSMVAATVMNTMQTSLYSSLNGRFHNNPIAANATFILPVPPGGTVDPHVNITGALLPGQLPAPRIVMVLATKSLRMEVVPVDECSECKVSTVLGLRTLGNIYLLPWEIGPFSSTQMFPWDGRLDTGEYAPAGKYKLVVMALHLFGDAANPEHYDRWDSPEFRIVYKSW